MHVDIEEIKNLIYILEKMEIWFRETADRERNLISVLNKDRPHHNRTWPEHIKIMNLEILSLYQKEIDVLVYIENNFSEVFIAVGYQDIIEREIPAVLKKLMEMRKYGEDGRQKKHMHESKQIMQKTAEYIAEIKQRLEEYITPTEPIYRYTDIR